VLVVGCGSPQPVRPKGEETNRAVSEDGASQHYAANAAATKPPAAADCKTPEEQIECAAACDAKQYTACATLGLAIINSGDRATLARGVELVNKACANKDPLGCGALGSLYMGGIGVVRDPPRALKLFEDACDAGDGISCESLGGYYALGGGGESNLEHAAPWYERACAMQRPKPCAFLAAFIHDGVKFSNSDRKRIPGLLETACKGDVALACKYLGDLYAKGELVGRDVKQANALYDKACKLGDNDGCAAKAE
jgi:uncharacterized protein